MKHETEHLIKIETPEDERRISERRKSDLSQRMKAERYDLLHDAVEGNVFQRLGKLERAIEEVEEVASERFTVLLRQEFDLLELCLQRYAPALVNAMVMDVAKQQYSDELVNRSPERLRDKLNCERNAEK